MLCANLQQNFPGTFSHFKRSRIIYRCADKRMSRDMCATTLTTAMEFSNGVNCWLYSFLKTLICFLSINEANESLWSQARIRFLRFLAACIINDGLNSPKNLAFLIDWRELKRENAKLRSCERCTSGYTSIKHRFWPAWTYEDYANY